MDTSVDDIRLRQLMEESQDTHSDSMRGGRAGLKDYVDALRDGSSGTHSLARAAAIGAGVAGAGLLVAGRASAASDDVSVLQTAASIENLAVATYTAAAGLSFIKNGNATVLAFAGMTLAQHQEHAKAFNAAATNAGGKPQNAPDPKYLKVVKAASLKSPLDVIGLAIALEDVAAQTYTKNASLVSTAELRSLFVSVAGVEAQHKAILLAVQALLEGGAPQLVKLGPPTAELPSAAGSVGFPNAFYPTSSASPAGEGAVA